jgi:hypothetical protein
MINFAISNSTTAAFIVIVLVVYNIYPHNPFNNSLLIALCCWIVAFGPLYWIMRVLNIIIPDREEDLQKFVAVVFLISKFGLLLAGLVLMVKGCSYIA